MLFINDAAVIPRSGVMTPAIGGGYSVKMKLHRAEHVDGFEPVYLFGRTFDKEEATKLLHETFQVKQGSWAVDGPGQWKAMPDWHHTINRRRIQERMAVK